MYGPIDFTIEHQGTIDRPKEKQEIWCQIDFRRWIMWGTLERELFFSIEQELIRKCGFYVTAVTWILLCITHTFPFRFDFDIFSLYFLLFPVLILFYHIPFVLDVGFLSCSMCVTKQEHLSISYCHSSQTAVTHSPRYKSAFKRHTNGANKYEWDCKNVSIFNIWTLNTKFHRHHYRHYLHHPPNVTNLKSFH